MRGSGESPHSAASTTRLYAARTCPRRGNCVSRISLAQSDAFLSTDSTRIGCAKQSRSISAPIVARAYSKPRPNGSLRLLHELSLCRHVSSQTIAGLRAAGRRARWRCPGLVGMGNAALYRSFRSGGTDDSLSAPAVLAGRHEPAAYCEVDNPWCRVRANPLCRSLGSRYAPFPAMAGREAFAAWERPARDGSICC